MKSKARLSWTKDDFEQAGEELPDSLVSDDLHTEGELMSREQIDEWLADTSATFSMIREQDETRFSELFSEYLEDLAYLVSLGKLSASEARQLGNVDLYQFEQ